MDSSYMDNRGLSRAVWISAGQTHEQFPVLPQWELVYSVRGIRGKENREFADSVLSVSIAANMGVTGELKGEGAMYEALMEIMEPDVRIRIEEGIQEGIQQGMQKYMQQGIQQGREEGIHNTVELLREFGHEETEIRRAIMKKYGLTSKKAEEYL